MKLRDLALVIVVLPLVACVEEVRDLPADDADTTGAMEEAVEQTEGQRPPAPVPEGVNPPGEDISREATRAREALRTRYESLLARYHALEGQLAAEKQEELREVEKDLVKAREQLKYVEKQLGRVWEQTREELDDNLDDIEGELEELSSNRQ